MAHKDKNIAGEVSGETDQKLLLEALMGEMRRVLRTEMDQVHERLDRVENARVEQPQHNAPHGRRRERVQPRGVRVEEEEYFWEDFDEENDQESIDNHRRYGGRGRAY